MTPIVNTEAKIPEKLFKALCLYETSCAVTSKVTTTEQEVRSWIEGRAGKEIADQFREEFLLPG